VCIYIYMFAIPSLVNEVDLYKSNSCYFFFRFNLVKFKKITKNFELISFFTNLKSNLN
jgi:hypothetical protein